jgi:hypothetical protein
MLGRIYAVITAPELTQLIIAFTGLITAFVTLWKVLNHEELLQSTQQMAKDTQTALTATNTNVTATRETLDAHLSALVEAAGAFHDAAIEKESKQ